MDNWSTGIPKDGPDWWDASHERLESLPNWKTDWLPLQSKDTRDKVNLFDTLKRCGILFAGKDNRKKKVYFKQYYRKMNKYNITRI